MVQATTEQSSASRSQFTYIAASFFGAVCFGGTLPALKLSYEGYSPIAAAGGRGLIAGMIALLIVIALRLPFPARSTWPALGISSFCLILAFPYLTAYSTHVNGAATMGVFISVAPLISASFAALYFKEQTNRLFWFCNFLAVSVLIHFYGVSNAQASTSIFLAVLCSGIGYAVCAKLSQQIGNWQSICWCLVITLPINAFVFGFEMGVSNLAPTSTSSLAILYLALFSQLIGFAFWNYGLSNGGVATMVQFQHLVPFISIVLAGLIAGEIVDNSVWLYAVLNVSILVVGLNSASLSRILHRKLSTAFVIKDRVRNGYKPLPKEGLE